MSKYLEYFDGAFDSTVANKMKLENKPYIAYSKTEGVVYTIVPKEDGAMYTIYRVVNKDISRLTYNMVDLGLFSGTLWADRNVGSASPEDYGSYFQWGDTNAYTFDGAGEITAAELASLLQPLVGDAMEVTKDNVGDILLMLFEGYDVGTDLTNTPLGALGFSLDKLFNWDSYFDTTDSGSTFNKYNNNEGLKVLESVDDAATANMGVEWRMPTKYESLELVKNTDHYYIGKDGNIVAGPFNYETNNSYKGLDHSNLRSICFVKRGEEFNYDNHSNFIEFPFAGFCSDSVFNGKDLIGYVWSSSVDVDQARALIFSDLGYIDGNSSNNRYFGMSVRGVRREYYVGVDLGLPSGVKWADRNVGAKRFWDNGAYFSWGNVDGHTVDENGNTTDGYSFDDNTYSTTLGGQYTGSELDAKHDAATANMGSDWRMPTSAETLELVENTDHYYIGKDGNIVAGPFNYDTNSSYKGLDGSKLRSICFVKKGEEFDYDNRTNFIEFPFAGDCEYSLLRYNGSMGHIWLSSDNEGTESRANYLSLYNNGGIYGGDNTANLRWIGMSVRGVQA